MKHVLLMYQLVLLMMVWSCTTSANKPENSVEEHTLQPVIYAEPELDKNNSLPLQEEMVVRDNTPSPITEQIVPVTEKDQLVLENEASLESGTNTSMLMSSSPSATDQMSPGPSNMSHNHSDMKDNGVFEETFTISFRGSELLILPFRLKGNPVPSEEIYKSLFSAMFYLGTLETEESSDFYMGMLVINGEKPGTLYMSSVQNVRLYLDNKASEKAFLSQMIVYKFDVNKRQILSLEAKFGTPTFGMYQKQPAVILPYYPDSFTSIEEMQLEVLTLFASISKSMIDFIPNGFFIVSVRHNGRTLEYITYSSDLIKFQDKYLSPVEFHSRLIRRVS